MDNEEAASETPARSGYLPSGDPSIREAENAILDEIADLLAKHKLVPFFGAGISRQHLGFAAAELAREIAPLVRKPPETLLSELADDFADQFGDAVLIEFLKSKLVALKLDDTKVSTHRLLLSFSPNLLYTTNQDKGLCRYFRETNIW